MHRRLRLPPENGPSLGGVTAQVDRIGGSQEMLFGADISLPIEPEAREGGLRNITECVVPLARIKSSAVE